MKCTLDKTATPIVGSVLWKKPRGSGCLIILLTSQTFYIPINVRFRRALWVIFKPETRLLAILKLRE